MDKSVALHRMWSSFSLPAYDMNVIPEDAVFPYITYEVSLNGFDDQTFMNASIWYNSDSWEEISKKTEEISEYIGYGGVTLPYDGGLLWVKRGSPFAQRMSDPNYGIRRMLISVVVEFLSEN